MVNFARSALVMGACACLLLGAPVPVAAQEAVITERDRAVLFDHLKHALEANYVFPDRVDAIMSALEAKRASGRYAAAADDDELAALVTTDLIAATGDYHFAVSHEPAAVGEAVPATKGGGPSQEANHGFREMRILPGNVGYIRFDYFAPTDEAYALATGAMQFVSGTGAVIFDLRYNNGGTLETAQLLMSYLFSGEKDRRLFQYFYNEDGKRIERGQWVLAGLPGKRMPDVPVYVLVSSTSFSAAEWMAFSLQELGRAKIVGQRTTGAAHPVTRARIDDDYVLQVPIGQISGPLSSTDFEGRGVEPDVVVPSHRALEVAHRMAIEGRPDAGWILPKVEATDAARRADTQAIVGRYEGRSVAIEDGVPIYRWRDHFSLALTPLGNGLFAVEGTDDYRFQLVRQGKAVIALERVFRDGRVARYASIPKP